jgi:hypothetical protein
MILHIALLDNARDHMQHLANGEACFRMHAGILASEEQNLDELNTATAQPRGSMSHEQQAA